MRLAAATALVSFFTNLADHNQEKIDLSQGLAPDTDPGCLIPVLSALYDGLIDDDDDIREMAARAATFATRLAPDKWSTVPGPPPPPLAPIAVVAPAAADRLVIWMADRFGGLTEFHELVMRRMTACRGCWQEAIATTTVFTPAGPGDGNGGRAAKTVVLLPPAAEQLGQALRFDDSLFMIEEQNLFVDEVREAERWRQALLRMTMAAGAKERVSGTTATSPSAAAVAAAAARPWLSALGQWATEGLQALIQVSARKYASVTEEGGDGPLGWTSNQHVFAVCARVVLSAGAVVACEEKEEETPGLAAKAAMVAGEAKLRDLLAEFCRVGGRTRVHGSLLRMAQE